MPKSTKAHVAAKTAEVDALAGPLAGIIKQRYEESVEIATLIEHPENPRKGDREAIEESIRANNFYGAVLVQVSTRHILIGNHRAKAATEVGLTHIPVLWVDCDDDTALRILLADNRTNDRATYDEEKLRDVLSKIIAKGEQHLVGTGYDATFVQDLMAKFQPPSLDELADKYGEGDADESAFWPVVRLKLAPEVKDRLDTLMADAPGKDDSDKLLAILACVDTSALEQFDPATLETEAEGESPAGDGWGEGEDDLDDLARDEFEDDDEAEEGPED